MNNPEANMTYADLLKELIQANIQLTLENQKLKNEIKKSSCREQDDLKKEY